MFGMGQIGGFCQLSIGQEAVIAGVRMAAQPGDQTIAGERIHGALIAAGVAPRAIMAELFGRREGCSGGLGGSMHMFAPEFGFFGGHGVSGSPVALGAGLAFANSYRSQDRVAWCHLDAESVSRGQVIETLESAARFRLPLVVIIENRCGDTLREGLNGSVAASDLSQRGRSFGIRGWQVDGIDVRAVHDAAVRAGAFARSGQGPFILEMLTLPFRGHAAAGVVGSASQDRDSEDPIAIVRQRLAASGVSDGEFGAWEKEVGAVISEAVGFAEKGGEPDPGALQDFVFAKG